VLRVTFLRWTVGGEPSGECEDHLVCDAGTARADEGRASHLECGKGRCGCKWVQRVFKARDIPKEPVWSNAVEKVDGFLMNEDHPG
jgi:hypothetical protein